MFPVNARCVTFDAGWPAEQVRAAESLELGKVYTIRSMYVGQSDSHLSFYEVPGQWSTVFFEAFYYGADDYEDLMTDETPPHEVADDITQGPPVVPEGDGGKPINPPAEPRIPPEPEEEDEPPGGNDPEAQ